MPLGRGATATPLNRSQWIQSEGLWEQRRRDGRRHAAGRSPRAGQGPVLLQEPEPTLPYVPGPFSAQELFSSEIPKLPKTWFGLKVK